MVLKDKIAVVTGGGSGIGKSITERFHQEGATVHVLEIDESKEKDIVTGDGRVVLHVCNVADQSSVRKAIDEVISHSGRIDILVNNAGVAHIGTAETTSEEDFDRIYNINIKGVYNCLHVVIPHMKKGGGGVILNLASVAALVAVPDRFAYSTSKGAVLVMTYSVARDFIHDNIRCNSISPGRVHTPFVDGYIAKTYKGKEKEMFEKLSKRQPIGRMGKPEEMASLALFLCSDEASFITGTDYPIDGGYVKLNT